MHSSSSYPMLTSCTQELWLNSPPPHSPFGIRQDLPFDFDALSRLDVQLSNNQSLQGKAQALVSPKASLPALLGPRHKPALANPKVFAVQC